MKSITLTPLIQKVEIYGHLTSLPGEHVYLYFDRDSRNFAAKENAIVLSPLNEEIRTHVINNCLKKTVRVLGEVSHIEGKKWHLKYYGIIELSDADQQSCNLNYFPKMKYKYPG